MATGTIKNSNKRISIPLVHGQSKTIRIDSASWLFLLTGVGWDASINSICFLIGGYSTASRALVTNLTGITGITVDSSSTTSRDIIVTNVSSIDVTLDIIPLREEVISILV